MVLADANTLLYNPEFIFHSTKIMFIIIPYYNKLIILFESLILLTLLKYFISMAEFIKKHLIDDLDRETIKRIASKAKEMRLAQGYTYEDFAIHARINRNTYFKFEKSSVSGDNYTIAILLKVIRGLNETPSSFFTQL
jgi:hypothetical protein